MFLCLIVRLCHFVFLFLFTHLQLLLILKANAVLGIFSCD